MKIMRVIAGVALVASVSACASVPSGDDAVTRTTPFEAETGAAALPDAPFTVRDVRVSVPKTLTVSEADGFYPNADIVWREDPYGDRHQQVASLVTEAMTRGTEALSGSEQVILEVQINQFHALTQRARYTIGGLHEITFSYRVLDARSGEEIVSARNVDATFSGYGGKKALEAERQGITQKVRISDHLAGVIRSELAKEAARL